MTNNRHGYLANANMLTKMGNVVNNHCERDELYSLPH